MKIFLDDIRNPPIVWKDRKEWTVVRDAPKAIQLLETGLVTSMSLDHDLGLDVYKSAGTGYDVVLWLEEKVHTDSTFVMPDVKVHSQNPVGRKKMIEGLQAIYRYLNDQRAATIESNAELGLVEGSLPIV